MSSTTLPECDRGYLREVHGGDAGVESRVDADDEPAEDEEEVGVGILGGDHAHPAHRHQDVVQQQAALWNDLIQVISDNNSR